MTSDSARDFTTSNPNMATSCPQPQVVYRWVVSYIVQEVHADRLSLRDYYQIFSADFASRGVLRKSAALRTQREKLFMEMLIAGVIKEAGYTFHYEDHTYNFNFNLKGCIGLIKDGHISLSSTTSTFSIDIWDNFELFMSNLDLSTDKEIVSAIAKFEESLTSCPNKLYYWDEYLNLRHDMLTELDTALPCQFRSSFPSCLTHKIRANRPQPWPMETDVAKVRKAVAVLLALGFSSFEAEGLGIYSEYVDVEYFERLLKKNHGRKNVYGDTKVDI
jgi:hypothetical protein